MVRVATGTEFLFDRIEFGVFLDISEFIEDELPVLQEEGGVEFGDGDFGKALDGEEALEFVCLADDHLVALGSDDTVTLGFISEADVALAESLCGELAGFNDRIEQFFYLLLQDCGGHIHAAVLHPGVGLAHGQEVLVDFRLQFLVVDGDFGPEFAFLVELLEVRNLGPDTGAVIKGNVSSIYETKPDSQGVSLA